MTMTYSQTISPFVIFKSEVSPIWTLVTEDINGIISSDIPSAMSLYNKPAFYLGSAYTDRIILYRTVFMQTQASTYPRGLEVINN